MYAKGISTHVRIKDDGTKETATTVKTAAGTSVTITSQKDGKKTLLSKKTKENILRTTVMQFNNGKMTAQSSRHRKTLKDGNVKQLLYSFENGKAVAKSILLDASGKTLRQKAYDLPEKK